MELSFADQNVNGIHGKIQQSRAFGNVIFEQIWEKYKKHKNIFDTNENIILS